MIEVKIRRESRLVAADKSKPGTELFRVEGVMQEDFNLPSGDGFPQIFT
jgi:hypothetical protein